MARGSIRVPAHNHHGGVYDYSFQRPRQCGGDLDEVVESQSSSKECILTLKQVEE